MSKYRRKLELRPRDHEFLKDLRDEWFNPTCPVCTHPASMHTALTGNVTKNCHHEEEVETEDLAGHIRISMKHCACTYTSREVRANVARIARKAVAKEEQERAAALKDGDPPIKFKIKPEDIAPTPPPPAATGGQCFQGLACSDSRHWVNGIHWIDGVYWWDDDPLDDEGKHWDGSGWGI